jgi:hypothetical protein
VKSAQAVRIVRAPIGEAPAWVREAWVGLTLPLAPGRSEGRWRTIGVLSGPRSWLGGLWALLSGRAQAVEGFGVDAATAVDRLAAHDPEAAEWWRREAGHMLRRGQIFIFDREACDPVVR